MGARASTSLTSHHAAGDFVLGKSTLKSIKEARSLINLCEQALVGEDDVPPSPAPSPPEPKPTRSVGGPSGVPSSIALWALAVLFLFAVFGPEWVRPMLIAGPILLAHVVVSFQREECETNTKGAAADEEAAAPVACRTAPSSGGVTVTQLLVAALAVLALAMIEPSTLSRPTAADATAMMLLNVVRFGPVLLAIMLCGVLVRPPPLPLDITRAAKRGRGHVP